ncbi:hypothetical protein RSOL_160940, partial [Rhizoctonia solani AG-3 Rhs1AP]
MSSNLDNSMDIDPQTDGPQPGFHRSNEGVPFDAAGFNSAVLNAIKQYKSSSTAIPPPFDKDELSPDEPILLYLVIRTFMPESHMNLMPYGPPTLLRTSLAYCLMLECLTVLKSAPQNSNRASLRAQVATYKIYKTHKLW